jgi:hypothetical protein
MPKTVEVHAPESAPAAGHGLNLDKIFRYAALFEEVVAVWEGARDLPVGGEADVPPLKIRIGGSHYEWEASKIKKID